MANFFFLDASALAKRYVQETGTPLMNYFFHQVPLPRMLCLLLGGLEVISTLVRKKNNKLLTQPAFQQTLTDFRKEVLDEPRFPKLSPTDVLVHSAIPLIDQHALNATDAVVLRLALDLATRLSLSGNGIVLVASDRRLLRAAQAEGLTTFDPESQPQADLDALL